MNKLAKTTIISFLSISAFGLTVAPQANALTSKAINFDPTPTYPSSSQLNLSELSQEQQVADITGLTQMNEYLPPQPPNSGGSACSPKLGATKTSAAGGFPSVGNWRRFRGQ